MRGRLVGAGPRSAGRRLRPLVVVGDRRRRGVVRAAPEHELLLAELLEGLLLVLALQRAVVPLVEPPRAPHRDPVPVGRVEGEVSRCVMARRSTDVCTTSGSSPRSASSSPPRLGLGAALVATAPTSTQPVNRFLAFQSLSPCRSRTRGRHAPASGEVRWATPEASGAPTARSSAAAARFTGPDWARDAAHRTGTALRVGEVPERLEVAGRLAPRDAPGPLLAASDVEEARAASSSLNARPASTASDRQPNSWSTVAPASTASHGRPRRRGRRRRGGRRRRPARQPVLRLQQPAGRTPRGSRPGRRTTNAVDRQPCVADERGARLSAASPRPAA